MPKTNEFTNRESKSGEFSCHIRKDVNDMLTIYCKINNVNKTVYVNQLVEKDMITKFNRLHEEGQ